MAENIHHLAKDVNLQVQEAEQTFSRINPKKPTPRHIVIKLLKTKDKGKNLEAAREIDILSYGEKQFKGQQISHWKP